MALDGFVGPVPGVEAMSTAPDWEAFFAAMFPSGIEAGVGDEFAPALDAGARAIVIGSGRARLRAYVANATTSTSTPIDAPDTQGRIDRLALRLDRSATTAANWIKPKLIKGTPGSSPVAPSYTNSLASTGVWDLPIARWTSAANGSLSGLVDERYKVPAPLLALGTTQWAPGGVGLAITPDKVLASRDGNTWDTVLYEDTGYQDVTLDTSHFSQGSVPLSIARISGVIYLTGQVECKITGNDSFGIGWLPDWATPRKSTPITAYGEGGNPIQVTAYASGDHKGQIWVVGNVPAIAVKGRGLAINASWPALRLG